MPTPSIHQQAPGKVWSVPAWSLVPSPRNYNASIAEFEGHTWMAYRSHRMDQGGRCSIVIAQMLPTWEARDNQWLNLPEQIHSTTIHHEDPRLFVYAGRLHVAYVETVFRFPAPYTCVIKYARLRRKSGRWEVERVFWPRYGTNDGSHQEKNWQFFEGVDGTLRCIYKAEPHTVLQIEDEKVVGVTASTGGTKWPWGTMRGGSPPILQRNGEFITFFHSSMPYPVPPHYRRYYAGAYTFAPKPPYDITAISQRPILTGSEEDGHGFDPRNIDSWKPFVVFPSGAVRKSKRGGPESWFVSYGVNDHMVAVVEHERDSLGFGEPGFASWPAKFFFTENGNLPVRVFDAEDKPPRYIRWDRAKGGAACQQNGVLSTDDPRLALMLLEVPGVREIGQQEYTSLKC